MAGFDVYDVDVHVEPAALPEEEHFASRALELLPKEETLLNGKHLDQLLAPQFQAITTKGKIIQQEEYIASAVETEDLAIKITKQSKSAKDIYPHLSLLGQSKSYTVSSIWRRNEYWRCIYRQVTGES